MDGKRDSVVITNDIEAEKIGLLIHEAAADPIVARLALMSVLNPDLDPRVEDTILGVVRGYYGLSYVEMDEAFTMSLREAEAVYEQA